MISPENRLFCRLDQKPGSEQEQQRLKLLHDMGLLDTESVPIFEEATQTAAHFLDAPICILGLLDSDREWFKSAVGLSRMGLMNELASSRQLSRQESFCTYVVDSQQVLAISDTFEFPALANLSLVQRYGIRAYLGVPLMVNQYCLGTLAVMSPLPRCFTPREIEFLQITARWSMSEFERNHLLKTHVPSFQITPIAPDLPSPPPATVPSVPTASSSIKASLIAQMTQELCTPLTSILGMASVLGQGIYGTLSDKQKEYIEIIHNSGQYLLSLVNEIVELGALDDTHDGLNLSSIDIEMLCQQAIASLNRAAQRRDQQIQLTIEPGPRIWLLDKDKVRQMLYHLVFSVIQSSTSDSIIRLHVSRKDSHLNLMVWTSHPWLGDGLPQAELQTNPLMPAAKESETFPGAHSARVQLRDRFSLPSWPEASEDLDDFDVHGLPAPTADDEKARQIQSRQALGLLLTRHLAEMHEGSVGIRGSIDEGYRYVIRLPQLKGGEKQVGVTI